MRIPPPAAALLLGFALTGADPASAAVVVTEWDLTSQVGRAGQGDERSGPAGERDDAPAVNPSDRCGTTAPPAPSPLIGAAAPPAAVAVAAGAGFSADLPRDRRFQAVFYPGGLFRPPRSA